MNKLAFVGKMFLQARQAKALSLLAEATSKYTSKRKPCAGRTSSYPDDYQSWLGE